MHNDACLFDVYVKHNDDPACAVVRSNSVPYSTDMVRTHTQGLGPNWSANVRLTALPPITW